MNKTISLKIKRGLTIEKEKKILQFKGLLISNSYTDIIHIADKNEDCYLNFFTILPEKRKEILDFITRMLKDNNLTEEVIIV